MKKIALCSLIVCLGIASVDAFADCTPKRGCGGKTVAATIIGYEAAKIGVVGGGLLAGPVGSIAGGVFAGVKGAKWGWDHVYEADEYVYFSDGTCLECDTPHLYNSGECTNNTYITNGNKLLRCNAPAALNVGAKNGSLSVDVGVDDKWVEESISICSNSPVKKMDNSKKYKISLKGPNERKIQKSDGITVVYSGKPCKYIEEEASTQSGKCSMVGEILTGPRDCSTYDQMLKKESTARTGKTCSNICLKSKSNAFMQHIVINHCEQGQQENKAFPNTVLDNFNAESQAKLKGYIYRCDDKAAVIQKPKKEKSETEKPKKEKSETEKPKKETKPVDDCDSFSGADRNCCLMAKANVTEFDKDTKSCKCLDVDFHWDATKGACIRNQDCEVYSNVRLTCANGSSYTGEHRFKLTTSELSEMKLTCDEIKAAPFYDAATLPALTAYLCARLGTRAPDGPSQAEVDSAASKLKSFFQSANDQASVWKDAEGKFNTARLASDLTAGVVLGTVGGVVSGVVIKKKQLEKGFDVLHCTVGGQKIADYGDTFSVGLNR